ncbi:MAG TPA: hypothetical protein VKR79_00625 [Gaiellaceae bacterium]|nr:hypothetical protein [Gaiellaceae bacterium]
MNEPQIALRVREHEEPALEIAINFGVFAGRHPTPAEIDELAHALRELAPEFAILAEERHEFGGDVEASVLQVVVEIPREHAGPEPDVLAERIVLLASGWALSCIASRHALGDLEQ